MDLKFLKATGPLEGDSFLLTTKSPGVPGTHLINLGKMKGWAKPLATKVIYIGTYFFHGGTLKVTNLNKTVTITLNLLIKNSGKATASWNVVHCHQHALKIKVNNHRIKVDYILLLNNFL